MIKKLNSNFERTDFLEKYFRNVLGGLAYITTKFYSEISHAKVSLQRNKFQGVRRRKILKKFKSIHEKFKSNLNLNYLKCKTEKTKKRYGL